MMNDKLVYKNEFIMYLSSVLGYRYIPLKADNLATYSLANIINKKEIEKLKL